MCAHETDIDDTVFVPYGHDQPVLVPHNVEDDPIISDKTGIAIDTLRAYP